MAFPPQSSSILPENLPDSESRVFKIHHFSSVGTVLLCRILQNSVNERSLVKKNPLTVRVSVGSEVWYMFTFRDQWMIFPSEAIRDIFKILVKERSVLPLLALVTLLLPLVAEFSPSCSVKQN
jgi:hypothetical protein